MVNSINGSKKYEKSSKRRVVNPKPSDVALEACGDSSCPDYGVNLIHGLVVYHRDWTLLEKRIIRTMGVLAYLSSAEFASGFDDVPSSYSLSKLGTVGKSKGKSDKQRKRDAEKKREKRLKSKLVSAGVQNG